VKRGSIFITGIKALSTKEPFYPGGKGIPVIFFL
jgi:hypothetical protein